MILFKYYLKAYLLASNLKYFTNMRLTIRSNSDMSSPYQRNDKNQNKELTFSANTDKDINFDLDPLTKRLSF